MAGMRIEPIAAVVAALEPEMAAKNIAESTVTMPNPPGNRPTSDCAKSIRRREMPDASINAPDRMKKGIAARGKLSSPANMRCARA